MRQITVDWNRMQDTVTALSLLSFKERLHNIKALSTSVLMKYLNSKRKSKSRTLSSGGLHDRWCRHWDAITI